MLALLKSNAIQLGVVGTCAAAGYVALKKLTPAKQLHPLFVNECPQVVAAYPTLCEAVSALLLTLDVPEERATELVALVYCLHKADVDGGASQWKMSRLNASIEHTADRIVGEHKCLQSDEAFRAALNAKDDILPLLKSSLDAILHNHLLNRT